MGSNSKIEWTHHTFNPHWGCARVSPGCEHCYAEAFAKRVGQKVWGPKADRREFGDKHWTEPLKWNQAAARARQRHRVFCASMADVFEDHPVAERSRERLWPLIASTPHLDWLLLTKRPENIVDMIPWGSGKATGLSGGSGAVETWPNVWVGTTVEDQRRAEERIPILLGVPAAVRFLSCEPLLGPVDLTKLVDDEVGAQWNGLTGIDWVIVGGESGPGARVFNVEWARSILSQCRRTGVAVHVKQLGAIAMEDTRVLGRSYKQCNLLALTDRKGGNWNEWPADLRVREYPIGH